MKVVILCGGKGMRAFPLTEVVPKPMVPIGGTPILVHLMQLFADQGYRDFVLAAGHQQVVIQRYFANPPDGWQVDVVDTGPETDTGERLRQCRERLGERFFVTYGDGLCDVALDRLLALHSSHGGVVTVTAVPLACQFGLLEIAASGRIESFQEKPVLRDHWINAGFMVMDRAAFDRWEGTNLEREVLPRLAATGHAWAFPHDGFFKSLDTLKDQEEFERLLAEGQTPWRRLPHI